MNPLWSLMTKYFLRLIIDGYIWTQPRLGKAKNPKCLVWDLWFKVRRTQFNHTLCFSNSVSPLLFFFFFLAQFETANVSSHVPPFCFFALLFKSGEKQMSLTTEAALSFLDSSVNSSWACLISSCQPCSNPTVCAVHHVASSLALAISHVLVQDCTRFPCGD